MDAFFGNGTGWGEEGPDDVITPPEMSPQPEAPPAACMWSDKHINTFLKGCAKNSSSATTEYTTADGRGGEVVAHCPRFPSLETAKAACVSSEYQNCGGITIRINGSIELRSSADPIDSPNHETSYVLQNTLTCKPLPPDPVWQARAQGAYGAIARADGATARWIMQGWLLNIKFQGFGPPKIGPVALSRLHAYASAAPKGNFILTDMGTFDKGGSKSIPTGQWKEWQASWGIPFIWTALHTFGGNDGIRGNLSEVNAIPFSAPPLAPAPAGADPGTQVVGVGYTPEGLDQNPAYFELLQESAFKAAPEANLTEWLVLRAHRRYGLTANGSIGLTVNGSIGHANGGTNADVASAWANIGNSGYANDAPVHESTGVGLMPGKQTETWTGFGPDRQTPLPNLCLEWRAWGSLLAAAPDVAAVKVPGSVLPYPRTFSYDLVDIGREVMSQLTIPVSQNFSDAIKASKLNEKHLNATGGLYQDLLRDLDRLLSADTAFMLGPWLESARKLGGSDVDCSGTVVGDLKCDDFMEWNARSQLTTWQPTPKGAAVTGRPNDYARKHWSGLVSDYYAVRVSQYLEQALQDAAAGKPFQTNEMTRREVKLAFEFQTAFGNGYPTEPVEDVVDVSTELIKKWGLYFRACA
jgi:alpha-N-acetylglucosaminidase